jgi:hypothetical protein
MEVALMKWPWRRKVRLCGPRIRTNSKLMELETAKEILAEIFHSRPADVDEMIQSRLEERSWPEEENIWLEEHGEKLWPATFCLGD